MYSRIVIIQIRYVVGDGWGGVGWGGVQVN